jgi:hypothetical protein
MKIQAKGPHRADKAIVAMGPRTLHKYDFFSQLWLFSALNPLSAFNFVA